MNTICSLELCAVEKQLQKREIGVREVVDACLDRISATEDKIEALLLVDEEGAKKQAESLDASGPDASKSLWGIPVVIKDALSTKGMRTTAASRILENFVPFYDAFAVQKLRDAGAIILGKANMDEFAMGSSTENSAFKKTRNPWNTERVPGGSSGGSAASVAACQCFASLGSDTGGSIRQPAAFCGCVGLKPTYGRVSRYGLFAFGSSLDQIGPLARTVKDCALILKVIAGHDSRDATSAPEPCEDYLANIDKPAADKPMSGVRIGFPQDFFGSGLDEEIRNACSSALEHAKNLGAEIINVKLSNPDVASAVYYIIAMAEASSNLARYDGVRYGVRAAGISSLADLYLDSRSQGFGEEVKRRIMLGSFVLSSGYYDAYFKKAAQIRRLISEQYLDVFKKCDLICMPVAPVTAWPLESHRESPLQAYLMDAYTLPANLVGLPGLSLPVGIGEHSGMPVGMQLIGKPFAEAELLRNAYFLEQELPQIGQPSLDA